MSTMKNYSTNMSILINSTNNKKELVIDHKHIQNFHHTCVCYININDDKDNDISLQEEISQDDVLNTSLNFTNNLFISCEYIDTETVLKCTESVSPRVVVGSQTLLGNGSRELFCGVNAYELLADGWMDKNMMQLDGEEDDVFKTATETAIGETVNDVTKAPSHRKGTLSLDKDVDQVMSCNSAAVVSVGKIKVVF